MPRGWRVTGSTEVATSRAHARPFSPRGTGRVAREVVSRDIGFVIGPYNSSVGLADLPLYRRSGVLPLWMTSRDETRGAGATVPPMNSQIAPVESRYVSSIGARVVTMLVDDTPTAPSTRAWRAGSERTW